ncbi:MAG: esterase family protein [Deltaproteobacteria bacterium]|nr:esterase family protein [Deltaproteobacteria bacterium]
MRPLWLLALAATLQQSCTPNGEPVRPTSPSAASSSVTSTALAPPPVSASPSASAAPAASAPAPNPPRGKAKAHVETRSFASAALGVDKKYQVYLPRGYDDSAHRFPVAYYLHGLGGNESNWVTHGLLDKAADALDLAVIVVMPDGDDSFYVNHPKPDSYEDCLKKKPPFDGSEPAASYCVRTPSYEDYIARDLVAQVDGAFRTIADRRSRAIAGLSMGGFGAMQLAMRHTDLYSAVATHSGMLYLTGTSTTAEPGKIRDATSLADWGKQYQAKFHDHVAKVMGPNFEAWREHDPSVLATKLQPGSLAIMFDCGDHDGFNFHTHGAHLHQVLQARGYKHDYAQLPGSHDWKYWSARVPVSLKFLSDNLQGAAPGP